MVETRLANAVFEDEPTDALRPSLRSLAENIAGLLRAEMGQAHYPLLIAGGWGIGKTSLLKGIRSRLGARGSGLTAEDPIAAVWFEAWHYERNDGLVPALVRAIWDATPDVFRQDEKNKDCLRQLWCCALALTARLLPFLTGGAIEVGLKVSGVFDDVKALGGTATEPALDPVGAFQKSVATLIQRAWGLPPGADGSASARQPIVFIDDLDRCGPETMVSLLETIRLLAASGEKLRCRFVVALDRDVAVDAASYKFGGLDKYDGNRYLEKIFPATFRIGEPDGADCADIIAKLLPRTNKSAGDGLAGVATDVFAQQGPFSNPRLIKRSLSRLRLLMRFDGATWDRDYPRQKAMLEWLAAGERWPGLRRLVLTRDTTFWRLVLNMSLGPPPGEIITSIQDPDARQLATQPGLGEWIGKHLVSESSLDNIKDAERRLRRWGL
jgi:hypothetical protein